MHTCSRHLIGGNKSEFGMGPVHGPAAVTIPLQKHSKQKDNTQKQQNRQNQNQSKNKKQNAKGKVIGGPVQ